MTPAHQAPDEVNFPIVSYTDELQSEFRLYQRHAMLQQTYDGSALDMSSVGNTSPMLGVDHSPWNLRRRQGSFAEFSDLHNGLKNAGQSSTEDHLISLASTSSLEHPQSPYQSLSGSSTDSVLKADKASPSTVYSNYSSPGAGIDQQALAYLASESCEATTKNAWWQQVSRQDKDQTQDIYGMCVPHDGLHDPFTTQQQWNYNVWNIPAGSTSHWVSTQTVPATVSPKALTLNVPPAPLSSSGSSLGRALSISDSNTDSSSGDDNPESSGAETFSQAEGTERINRGRQPLPDAVPWPRNSFQVLPSNGVIWGPRKRQPKAKSRDDDDDESINPFAISSANGRVASSKSIGQTALQLLVPKPVDPNKVQQQVPQDTLDRDAKDEFLVKSKLAGMSYKDIRRQGNFVEAESTLRGRFRTLTKHKNARVRKPEWCENDVRTFPYPDY